MSARILRRKGLCGCSEVAAAPPLAGVMQGPGEDDPKWKPDNTEPMSPFLRESSCPS